MSKKMQSYRCARRNRLETETCGENILSEILEVEPLTQMHFNATAVREKCEKQRGESERRAERNQDIIKQRKESCRQYDLLLFKMEYIENNAAIVCTVSRESS